MNVTTVVNANLITNRLSIRVISIDGSPAETAARQKRINILPVEEFIKITDTGTSKPPTDQSLFTVGNDGALIRYTGKETNVVIRSVIKGIFVTSIGGHALRRREETCLTSVIIPNSVTSIDYNAFENNQLTSVTIPNSVTSIGNSAFSGNQLTSITIGKSVTSIGDSAFLGNQLTSVNIPNNVTSIGEAAFDENPLTSITIGADVKIDDYSWDNNYKNFIRYYNQNGKKAGIYRKSGNNWGYSAR
jgi:hypothetical protein